MTAVFYLSASVAVAATLLAVTRASAMHALLYLLVSLLSVAVIFFVLGAPFVAALEVIIYAGAIMVLFVFAVMLLNLRGPAEPWEIAWLRPQVWAGPAALAGVLLAELGYLVLFSGSRLSAAVVIGPKEVGAGLFGPYLLGVELASLVLLAGLVAAFHLGRRRPPTEESEP
jgi:NADH-quinone oxidoreductase subunit J